jgi:hypothetical protein
MLLFLNIISLYIEALVPSFHMPLKTSSIKFFGLLSEIETPVRIACDPTEIRTGHLPNTSQKHHCLSRFSL